MSLVEVMISLFIVAMTALAVVPMFATAALGNAKGRDHGLLGAMALEKMEDLIGEDYARLYAGGSLTSDVTDYFETDSGFSIRWEIVNAIDPANSKVLSVRVIAEARGTAPPEETTLVSLRARP